jgi:hypothetical protein
MSAAPLPVVVILVAIALGAAALAGRIFLMLARAGGDAVLRFITIRYLVRQCGSRARANRFVRAAELETRTNAFYSLARSSLFAPPSLAPALGRSARLTEGIPPKKLVVGSVTR